MKTRFLFLLLLFTVLSSSIYSKDIIVKIKGVAYRINSDKTATVIHTEYKKNSSLKGEVFILPFVKYKKEEIEVTEFSEDAFWFHDKITFVHLPNTIKSIRILEWDNYLGKYGHPFQGFIISNENKYYTSVDGVLFNKDLSILVCYPSKKSGNSYEIPSTVTKIGDNSFQGNSNLKKVNISSSVLVIGNGAFAKTDIESLNLPGNLVSIGEHAFTSGRCFNSSLLIPYSVLSIGDKAFQFCGNLEKVKYENDKTVFGKDAFGYCGKLTKENIIYAPPTDILLAKAEAGKPEAQYFLARAYMKGEHGFTKNLKSSFDWFMKASQNGHVKAQIFVAVMCEKGIGTDVNIPLSIEYYTIVANNGDAGAQRILGKAYLSGTNVEKDEKKGFSFLKMAAEQKDIESCSIFGNALLEGELIEKKEIDALYYLSTSSSKYPKDAFVVGKALYHGKGIKKDQNSSLWYFEKAIEGGIADAKPYFIQLTYNKAASSMSSKNYSSAISEFSDIIKYDKKNTLAYINRGYCHLNSNPIDYDSGEADCKKALALEPNNATALQNLKFVQDYKSRTAEAKRLIALGDTYYNNKDYSNAVFKYSQSMSYDNTNPYPYYSIGYCYLDCNLFSDARAFFNKSLRIDPNYDNARKGIKSANTKEIGAALVQVIQSVAQAYANSLNSSYNRGSSTTPSSSSSSRPAASSYTAPATSKSSSSNTTPTFGVTEKQVCYICDGKGYVKCGYCTDGYSSWTSKTICSKCNGTNRLKCGTCYGEGKR